MTWMNEWEVREAQDWFDEETQPNLKRCAEGLLKLMEWTNGRSDGWAYWQVPSKSAEKLMARLEEARGEQRRGYEADMSSSQMGAVFRPIRAMLRKQEVEKTDSVLFPKPHPALDWWQIARDKSAEYDDWREEVRNEETLLGFRDWLENRKEMADRG